MREFCFLCRSQKCNEHLLDQVVEWRMYAVFSLWFNFYFCQQSTFWKSKRICYFQVFCWCSVHNFCVVSFCYCNWDGCLGPGLQGPAIHAYLGPDNCLGVSSSLSSQLNAKVWAGLSCVWSKVHCPLGGISWEYSSVA